MDLNNYEIVIVNELDGKRIINATDYELIVDEDYEEIESGDTRHANSLEDLIEGIEMEDEFEDCDYADEEATEFYIRDKTTGEIVHDFI